MTFSINFNTLPNELILSVLDYLDPLNLATCRVSEALKGASEAKVNAFFKSLELDSSFLINQNCFEITQNYVEKLIKKVESFQNCPIEMQEIAKSLKNRICNALSEDIKRLQVGINACDILIKWEKLVDTANGKRPHLLQQRVNIPQVDLVGPGLANLTTIKEVIEKEKEYSEWFKTNIEELGHHRSLVNLSAYFLSSIYGSK